MGFAQGSLIKSYGIGFIDRIWNYLESQVEQALVDLPEWLDELIADVGLDIALDLTEDMTKFLTPEHFYDELQGITDASGADYQTLVRIHMVAGLTQGACSMFGAWGDALANHSALLQMRALDWDMDGPFKDYNQITVYHPTDGHDFLNIGFTAFVGGLSGYSEKKLAISEIGATYPDSSFGYESRVGTPFIFVLREILQFDNTLEDSINRLETTHRTCNLILGVGDGKSESFRGFEYSFSVCNVFDDTNMMPYNETWHPRMTDIVYWGMDWDCPSFNYVLSQQLTKYYGQITPEIGMQYISSIEQSGTNHVIFYDFSADQVFVSFGAPSTVGGPQSAYDRQYTRVDATALFNEQPPSM